MARQNNSVRRTLSDFHTFGPVKSAFCGGHPIGPDGRFLGRRLKHASIDKFKAMFVPWSLFQGDSSAPELYQPNLNPLDILSPMTADCHSEACKSPYLPVFPMLE